ncbi:flavoprotein monooxygenase [Dactylonectria macrodidyma]|uniref:Flavoprotein monooxygenase n=1 Tax=Dactylonectria macrodidyma TaxID=307937 RepID=A0A9P9J0J9_9HYPO|nr:flavoprotein monooxygenase [Dactylonectria macrodidyma]
MDNNKVSSFKVIVVGGGPIGLTAAHALHLAGIDFVVLERRPNIVEDQGASLVVYPHTFRVLYQFGILEKVLSVGSELNHHLSITSSGHVFKEGTRYDRVRENHGYGPAAFHRAELIEIMYNGLPAAAKEKVLTDKKLVDIETSKSGVKVTCADGSVYQGSMVMGADGVYSKTRRLMRDLALGDDPSRAWDPEEPFIASYQVLFGAFPTPSDPGLGYDIQTRHKSIMYLSGHQRSWFFLYKKLPKPTKERMDYTDQDLEALSKEFAEFPLTQTVKVKDVWPRMLGAGLTNLHEGIVQHWSLGRIVLVGDACHKLTTHLGLGYNNGVQDVVVLCNSLRDAVRAAPDRNPDASALTQVFEKYETARKSPASSLVADLAHSGMETRMHAWANMGYYVLSRFLIIPKFVEDAFVNLVFSPEIRKGQVLDYVPTEEPMKGKLSWLNPMRV